MKKWSLLMGVVLLVGCTKGEEPLTIERIKEKMNYIKKSSSLKESVSQMMSQKKEPTLFPTSRDVKLTMTEVYDVLWQKVYEKQNLTEIEKERSFRKLVDQAIDELYATHTLLNEVEIYNIDLLNFLKEVSLNTVNDEKNNPSIQVSSANTYYEIDLDSDGVKEKMYYKESPSGENYPSIYEFYLNNQLVVGGDNTICNDPKFAVVDLDVKDGLKEIMLVDDGPSADYESYYYRYQNEAITLLGKAPGTYDWGTDITGTGTLVASERSSILQTWWFDRIYDLKDNQLIPREEPLYTAEAFLFTIQDVPLYRTQDVKGDQFILKAGSTFKIKQTDNKEWCVGETEEGVEGWLKIAPNSFNTIEPLNVPAYEVFEGLSYAD